MAKKVSIKITAKEKALVEHYAYGIIAAGLAAHQIAPNDALKIVAIKALVGGLVAPLLARINPKSLVNSIDSATGLPATLTAPVVESAIADVNKVATQAENTK